MQLLLLAVILMLCGDDRQNYCRIKPIIEELGGAEAAEAITKAEELEKVISAVKDIQGSLKSENAKKTAANTAGGAAQSGERAAPLAPVAHIADERIAGALSGYIAMGE